MLSYLAFALLYSPREGLAFTDPEPTNLEECDMSESALTTAFSLSPDLPNVEIPRICIDTPGVSDQRCYYLYVPDCVNEQKGEVPLVFDIHGLESCPAWMVYFSGWAQKATEDCFVVVWPLGTIDPEISDETCWMAEGGIESVSEDGETLRTTEGCCYKDGWGNAIDTEATSDPEFLRNVAIDVVRNQAVDPKRVYMAGHSNGCMQGMSMAAQHSDIVAAVCCHAGFPITPVAENYSPVPVWLIHGQQDTIVPYEGLFMPGFVNPGGRDLWLMSAPSAAEYFADKNGCDLEETTTSEVEDGSSIKYSAKCDLNAEVVHVTIPAAGHNNIYPRYVSWLNAYYQTKSDSDDSYDIPEQATAADTTSWAWDFCSSHTKETVPKAFRGLKKKDAKPCSEDSSSESELGVGSGQLNSPGRGSGGFFDRIRGKFEDFVDAHADVAGKYLGALGDLKDGELALEDLKSMAQDDLAYHAGDLAYLKAKVDAALGEGAKASAEELDSSSEERRVWRCSSKLDAESCKDCGGKWKSINGCVKPKNSSNRARIRSATAENQGAENHS